MSARRSISNRHGETSRCPRGRVAIRRFERPRARLGERGEIMLEAVIVFPITLFLLFFILSMYTMMYQRWNIQTVANGATAQIAETYKYSKSTSDTSAASESVMSGVMLSSSDAGTMDALKSVITGLDMYRYAQDSSTWETAVKSRVKAYVDRRIDLATRRSGSTTATFTTTVNTPSTEVAFTSDGIARYHIAVTVTGTYQFPFGGVLGMFGIDPSVKFSYTSRADLLDLSDYLSTVNFIEDTADRANYLHVGSALNNAVSKAKSLMRSLKR